MVGGVLTGSVTGSNDATAGGEDYGGGSGGGDLMFEIVHIDPQVNTRHRRIFLASSPPDRESWITSITKGIDLGGGTPPPKDDGERRGRRRYESMRKNLWGGRNKREFVKGLRRGFGCSGM